MSALRPGVAGMMIDHLQLNTTMLQVESMTLALEGMFDKVEQESSKLNAIITAMSAPGLNGSVALEAADLIYLEGLGIPSASLSLEGLRDQVKVVWKNIIKHIIGGMKKVKAWAKKIATAVPQLKKLVDKVSKMQHSYHYSDTVTLKEELAYLSNGNTSREQILKDLENTQLIVRDCFEIDFPSVVSAAETTVQVVDRIPDAFNGNLEDISEPRYGEAKEIIKQLMTLSRVDVEVGESKPPVGIWSESVNVKGITTERHLTFAPRYGNVLGGRLPLYRYPRFNSEGHKATLKHLPTIVSYSKIGTKHLSSSQVDVYSRTINTSNQEVEVKPLSENQIKDVCRTCYGIIESFELYYDQIDDLEKIKERLIKSGNKAVSIITDDGDDVKQSTSEFVRNVVRFQAMRLDKPYVSLMGHGVRSMYALMSYAQKSLG